MIQALTTERLNIMQLIMQAFGFILAFIGFIVIAGTYLERSSGFERIDSRSDSTSYVAGGVVLAISASLWVASRQRACVKAAVQCLEEIKEEMEGEEFTEDVDSDRSEKFSAHKQSFRGALRECRSGVLAGRKPLAELLKLAKKGKLFHYKRMKKRACIYEPIWHSE